MLPFHPRISGSPRLVPIVMLALALLISAPYLQAGPRTCALIKRDTKPAGGPSERIT
jgi:hypothetical protein